ncbi:MAG: hypothetical protein ACD_10C00060G0001 [uncultured bacterium]|nr:MAG: hypothetical protein ACD_10C00060G0001 [uncultured bacterium]
MFAVSQRGLPERVLNPDQGTFGATQINAGLQITVSHFLHAKPMEDAAKKRHVMTPNFAFQKRAGFNFAFLSCFVPRCAT